MRSILHYEYTKALIPGVFALVNEFKKKIDIRYSFCITKSIVTILTKIRECSLEGDELVQDFNRLNIKFVILEEISKDSRLLRMRQAYWTEYYKNQRYKFYRYRNALEYRITIKIRNYLVYIELQNKNHDSLIIGVFDKMKDAKKFIEDYYPKKKVKSIVYALNALTRQYLLENPELNSQFINYESLLTTNNE